MINLNINFYLNKMDENEFWAKAELAMEALKIEEDKEKVPFEKIKQKAYNKDYYDRHKEQRRQEWIEKTNDPNYTYDKEYHKNYYEKNKEKMIAYQKRKVECECGMLVAYANLTLHRRYMTHKNKMKQKEEKEKILENKDDRCADVTGEIP